MENIQTAVIVAIVLIVIACVVMTALTPRRGLIPQSPQLVSYIPDSIPMPESSTS